MHGPFRYHYPSGSIPSIPVPLGFLDFYASMQPYSYFKFTDESAVYLSRWADEYIRTRHVVFLLDCCFSGLSSPSRPRSASS